MRPSMRPSGWYGRLLLGACAVLGSGCGSCAGREPLASRYVLRGIAALPVVRLELKLAAGAQMQIEARDPSAGTVPVLHLFDRTAGVELMRAAGWPLLGRTVRIAYRNPNGAEHTYALVLHASSNSSRGYVDLYRDGRALLRRAQASGVAREVAGGRGYVYQAAAVPGGATATSMYALDGEGRLLAIDDDSGPLGLPKIRGVDGVRTLLLGPPVTAHGAGPVNVYVNDPIDHDGDGLGRELEQALGTCDAPDQRGCKHSLLAGYYRAVRRATRDTDRDGLSDADELFGAGPGLDLPRWGADPRHKDVFVEVDHHKHLADAGLSEADIVEIAALFAKGSATDLRNPDGRPGVHLHLDVGFDPRDPINLGLFGHWGGSNPVKTSNYGHARASDLTPGREHFFRYAFTTRSGTGQARGDAFTINRDGRRVALFAHELGHTLGLEHHGNDAWGRANCKPNYLSIMNYVYQNKSEVGFSNRASSVINPASVIESEGVGPVPTPALAEAPLELDVIGRGVDWNRDGLISSTPVRAGLTWATYKSCGAAGYGRMTLSQGEALAATPVLLEAGNRLHALWVDATGGLLWRHGLTSGLDAHGSCPEGDSSPTRCMAWSTTATVPGLSGLRHVAAVAIDAERIALAYVAADGRLWSRVLAGATTTPSLTPAVEIPGVHTNLAPSVAWMDVDESFYGVSRVLAIFFRATATGMLMQASARDASGPFRTQAVLDARRQPITTGLSPTVTALGTGELCGVFANDEQNIRFHCYDRSRDLWVDLSQQAFYVGLGPRTEGKVGLAYHRYRAANGAPVDGDSSRGAVYLSFTQPESEAQAGSKPDNPHLLISQWLNAKHGAFERIDFRWRGSVLDQWTNLAPGTGVALYEDESLSALKALLTTRSAKGATAIDFLPFADGAHDESFGAGNDFQVMERSICTGLRGATVCGDKSTGTY